MAVTLARLSDGNIGNCKQNFHMFNNLCSMEITEEEPVLGECEE